MRLLGLVRPFRNRVNLAFGLGVARVVAFIGIGVLSALVVAGIKQGTPVGGLLIALYATAPLAGVLHWLESWVAHDMAFRLLTEMRIALYDKLDRLAPAYLLRRRTGDIVGMATQDVELVEYFFRPHRGAGAGRDPGAGGGGGDAAGLRLADGGGARALHPAGRAQPLPPAQAAGQAGRARARDAGPAQRPCGGHDPGADGAFGFRPAGGPAQGVPRYRAGPSPRAPPLLPRPHVPDGADRDGDRPRRACRGDGRHGLDRRRLAGGGDAAAARDPRHGDLSARLRDRPHRPATGGTRWARRGVSMPCTARR